MNKMGNYTANSEVCTLLVLRHNNNSVGIVQAVNEYGNLIDVKPDNNTIDTVIRAESSEDSFMDFYADFYNQLKNPSEYSFFKVREFEAYDTARGLQEYIDESSEWEKRELMNYEVCIDTVKAVRNQKSGDETFEDRVTGLGNDRDSLLGASSSFGESCSDDKELRFNRDVSGNNRLSTYRFQLEDVNWMALADLGLDRAKLEELGALEFLLKGYKTPMLIPVCIDEGKGVRTIQARLQLRLNDVGEMVVRVHRVLEKPDFKGKLMGYQFTKEDELNLLNSGNLGKVVDLVDPMTGEVIPSLVSFDRLTNELISLRMEFVRIPAVVCGVTLDFEQVKILRDGKALFIEDMLSKKGRLFSATVQFNTDRQWIEFLFERNLKHVGLKSYDRSNRDLDGLQNYYTSNVPTIFRGKYLRKWQIDKLMAGEVAYMSGLVNKNGKKYQGYLSFNMSTGKIEFSFKNPKKNTVGGKNVSGN
jgi:hypothetical protein